MSYAAECLARGRNMLGDALNGVRERRGRRWVLVLPVVAIGSFLAWMITVIASLVAMPWTWDEEGPGLVVCFVAAYVFVVLAAIVAPSRKRATALVLAAIMISFLYRWYAANPDSDWNWPRQYWVGLLSGVGLALILVFLRCQSRWLFLVPAYWLGFLTLMVPGLLLIALVSLGFPNIPPVIGLYVVVFFASFGAVAFPAMIALGHQVPVAVGCFLVNLAFGIDSLIEWHEHGDITYLTLPVLLLGGLAALTFIMHRAKTQVAAGA
jgi:MFS family permease